VRRIRGGKTYLLGGQDPASDLGGYRYTAFGRTVTAPDTAAPTVFTYLYQQPLRWQGRWYTEMAGGLYDFRSRVWSPELGAFLMADEFGFLTATGTLWSWPGQNPYRSRDPSGQLPWIDMLYPQVAALDLANWAGAAATVANILTPGAKTSMSWNGGDPVVLLTGVEIQCGHFLIV
jgi:RHS repeat-associated protein